MAVEHLVTEETSAGDVVARVLRDAGIDMVFGISGGHTGRIFRGLEKQQNAIRTVLVREESLGGVMAEVYGRLRGLPGVLIGQGPWVLGNGLLGTLEAHLSSSPMLLLTDFSDPPNLALHAPYQSGTGDYGAWDARRAFSGVTKQVFQALEPSQAVQATQFAIKHAMSGQKGPVAVLFSFAALNGKVGPDTVPALYPTQLYMPPPPPAADAAAVARAADALKKAQRPVIISGNGVRIAKAYQELRALSEALGIPVATSAGGKGTFPSASRPRMRSSARPTLCWWSARNSEPPTPRAKTPTCSIRRGRRSFRSISSRATHHGRSRPSTCWSAMRRRSSNSCARRRARTPSAARPVSPASPGSGRRRATSTRKPTTPRLRRSIRSGSSASCAATCPPIRSSPAMPARTAS
jgi:hypothetical protein